MEIGMQYKLNVLYCLQTQILTVNNKGYLTATQKTFFGSSYTDTELNDNNAAFNTLVFVVCLSYYFVNGFLFAKIKSQLEFIISQKVSIQIRCYKYLQ